MKGKTAGEVRGADPPVQGHDVDRRGSTSSRATREIPLGDLEALQGVVKFPVRIKCAMLGWNTLAQALDQAAAS